MTILIRVCYVLSAVLFMAGCSTVSVYKTKPNPSSAKLERILIIAMTNDYDTRSTWEQELSFRLRKMGYRMFSSVNVDKEKKDLFTREEIIELIDEKNIHGVITMRLKDLKTEEKYATSDRYISDLYNQHNYFFNYVDTYYNVFTWSYQPQQTVVIEANLFDGNEKSLIYQIDATMKNADSEEERVGEMTKSIAKAMASSGFLKKKDI
ncbi:MAG: hypothetical protein MI975_10755 [Cytophagales bacterium]|nr:hypothetical protein [Cytophagales bacterium]